MAHEHIIGRIQQYVRERDECNFPHELAGVDLALFEFILLEIAEGEKRGQVEWERHTLRHVVAMLEHQKHILKKIMATQAEIDAALQKIDAATNKLAANVQIIADTDQKISDEIDAFLKGNPAGTVLTDAQVAQLQALSDKAQATSDASDAQVEVLKAIAAKGAGNPVPVPVPPAPTP